MRKLAERLQKTSQPLEEVERQRNNPKKWTLLDAVERVRDSLDNLFSSPKYNEEEELDEELSPASIIAQLEKYFEHISLKVETRATTTGHRLLFRLYNRLVENFSKSFLRALNEISDYRRSIEVDENAWLLNWTTNIESLQEINDSKC